MLLLAGCQSLPPLAGRDGPPATAPPATAPPVSAPTELKVADSATDTADDPVVPAPPVDLWERLRQELTWQADADHPMVAEARENYLSQHDYLDVLAERSALYLYYILDEVDARGMPPEIALLPLVESLMDPFARSRHHAVGLWQIMPATGRHLGLTSNWWYDGRQDLRDSTRVALDYLQSLHDEFDGDWMLALAAYNSGKTRVRRAVASNRRAGKGTDYWSLSLPRETRHYVPRLLALCQIIAEPESYNAQLPPVPNVPAFAVADTGGQIELARAAQLAGIDEPLLRALNPGHLRWATAPEQGYELLVPPDALPRFVEGVASLPAEERVRWQHYTIKPGDSLSRIARKFGTEVTLLRSANKLNGSLIRAGDTLMIPQGNAWSQGLAMQGGSRREHGYQVQRGDSLYRIAGRFKVSVADIVSWNSLDPSAYLKPGQQLTLYLREDM